MVMSLCGAAFLNLRFNVEIAKRKIPACSVLSQMQPQTQLLGLMFMML